ncbi:MAG: toll/interleukin-1 receptor domain-containing protein, partial [Patescibacteria group bacterium]|nr:toll/interleukin-1 receptor domain-containing protein [Patescibacteria group bacterium]
MRVNMDVFISYRRKTGSSLCSVVRELLKKNGIDVFFDKDNIGNEKFPEKIKKCIEDAPNFLMILTPGYFVKRNGIDRVREEIQYAINMKKNFIL